MKATAFRFFLLALSIEYSSTAFCQSDSLIYFFDKDYNYCKKDDLIYIGFGIKENGKIKFISYVNLTGIPTIEGYYTDSTLAIKDGSFTFYDSLGYRVSE